MRIPLMMSMMSNNFTIITLIVIFIILTILKKINPHLFFVSGNDNNAVIFCISLINPLMHNAPKWSDTL